MLVPILNNPIYSHLDIVRKPFVGCKPSRLFQDPTNVIEPGRGPAFKSIICIFDTNYVASECQQMFDFVQNTIGSGNMMQNTIENHYIIRSPCSIPRGEVC